MSSSTLRNKRATVPNAIPAYLHKCGNTFACYSILIPRRHAGRKTVQVEDVMLLARRNEALADLLKDHLKRAKKQSNKTAMENP